MTWFWEKAIENDVWRLWFTRVVVKIIFTINFSIVMLSIKEFTIWFYWNPSWSLQNHFIRHANICNRKWTTLNILSVAGHDLKVMKIFMTNLAIDQSKNVHVSKEQLKFCTAVLSLIATIWKANAPCLSLFQWKIGFTLI